MTIRDKFGSAVEQLKWRKLMINGIGSKVCVTLYGKPPGQGDDNRVSGLEIWQRNYLLRLRSMGLDLVEIYFVWDGHNKIEKTHENRYALHLDDKKRVFQMEREANAYRLSYPKEARDIEDMLLHIFEREMIDSIILINWISTGMTIWQACLRFGKPVIFIPTEHSAVCHLGFFLKPSGSACSGPDGGGGCANCTHGIEPFLHSIPTNRPWYSGRFRLLTRMTSWLPDSLQKHALWVLAELLQPKHALLSVKEGMARIESAKRFLQNNNVLVLFQSQHQHQLFERAIGGRISVRTSLVIPANRDLIYESEKDTRRLSVGKGKIIFMFAARASFDRGLHFLLDVWSELTHRKNMIKLVVRCDAAGDGIEEQVARLQENGFDIDMVYGKLDDQEFVDLHRRMHFVVNPAMWEEPLAGSVIEGFDLGTPAIVPTRTGSSSFVKSGWNGYSYEFRDKGSLLQCLEAAVENITSWEHLHNGALATSRKYRSLTNLQLTYIQSVITPDTESRTVTPSGTHETVQDGISTLRVCL